MCKYRHKQIIISLHCVELRMSKYYLALINTTKCLLNVYNQSNRGVAQPGSAPRWGCGGRWFKSSRPDHL